MWQADGPAQRGHHGQQGANGETDNEFVAGFFLLVREDKGRGELTKRYGRRSTILNQWNPLSKINDQGVDP